MCASFKMIRWFWCWFVNANFRCMQVPLSAANGTPFRNWTQKRRKKSSEPVWLFETSNLIRIVIFWEQWLSQCAENNLRDIRRNNNVLVYGPVVHTCKKFDIIVLVLVLYIANFNFVRFCLLLCNISNLFNDL